MIYVAEVRIDVIAISIRFANGVVESIRHVGLSERVMGRERQEKWEREHNGIVASYPRQRHKDWRDYLPAAFTGREIHSTVAPDERVNWVVILNSGCCDTFGRKAQSVFSAKKRAPFSRGR